MDAIETSLFLMFVERRVCSARVRTMPRGIDQALGPRFFSETRREIVPELTTERARELAIRTSEPRLVLLRRKNRRPVRTHLCRRQRPGFFSGHGNGHHVVATTLAYG